MSSPENTDNPIYVTIAIGSQQAPHDQRLATLDTVEAIWRLGAINVRQN
jgi:hypothetical protein